MEIYVVQRGDTAWAIARRFDVPLERLIADNQLGEEAALTVGQALLIRGRRGSGSGGRRSPWDTPTPLFSRRFWRRP